MITVTFFESDDAEERQRELQLRQQFSCMQLFPVGRAEVESPLRAEVRRAQDNRDATQFTFRVVPAPHSETGPAVTWPAGQAYFWRGVQVPEKVVMAPETITYSEILNERNAEVRRVMLERMGYERFLLESGSVPVHQDETGSLYRVTDITETGARWEPEALTLVHVINSTPEPDGTRRRYVLRVPPAMRTAREAVAWTFRMSETDYKVTEES